MCNSALARALIGVVTYLVLSSNSQGVVSELPTSETALLGRFARGPVDLPLQVNAVQFSEVFASDAPASWPAEIQAREFFANGGLSLHVARLSPTGLTAEVLPGHPESLTGLYALEPISNLRILMLPELSDLPANSFADVFGQVDTYVTRRRLFLILNPPTNLVTATAAVNWVQTFVPDNAAAAAVYFPYLAVTLDGMALRVPAGGAMAAIFGKSDAAQGIWRSPAGTSFPLQAQALHPALGTADHDLLTANHLNAIRHFTGIGIVPFGARTLDRVNVENRFIPIVRTRHWIAATVERSLSFAANEDNGEPLWAQIRGQVTDFLEALFRRGALLGTTAEEAYFVRCDASTTTLEDIAANRVRVRYGVALLRPGEFDVTSLAAAVYDSSLSIPTPRMHVRAHAGDAYLAFPTVAGFDYGLEVSVDPAPPGWAPGGPVIAGDGAWHRLIIPMTAPQAFYRLRITSQR